jgi:hypothetical protein
MRKVKFVQYMSVCIYKEKQYFTFISKDIWNYRSISIPQSLGELWLGSSVMEQFRPSLPYINGE